MTQPATWPVPSIGRVVHYVARGSVGDVFPKTCRAADVTEVDESGHVPSNGVPLIGLLVKNPTGFFFHPIAAGGAEYDGSEDPAGGTWHWPERV